MDIQALAGQVSSLIVPHDRQWEPALSDRVINPAIAFQVHDPTLIEQAARLLQGPDRAVLILGGRAFRRQGLQAATAIQNATGCDLMSETFPARIERGKGLPEPARKNWDRPLIGRPNSTGRP
jgi:acetolactate synthase-1/2/3 large subunit